MKENITGEKTEKNKERGPDELSEELRQDDAN